MFNKRIMISGKKLAASALCCCLPLIDRFGGKNQNEAEAREDDACRPSVCTTEVSISIFSFLIVGKRSRRF